MSAPTDERCAITELLKPQCAHCLGLPDPDATGDSGARKGRLFRAAMPGRCSTCAEMFEEGTRIRADGEGSYECEGCVES